MTSPLGLQQRRVQLMRSFLDNNSDDDSDDVDTSLHLNKLAALNIMYTF